MDGFFKITEFWNIYSVLRQTYPQFVGEKFEIGKTYEGRPIEAFFLSKGGKNEPLKNIILFTGQHHAREFMTLTMIIEILAQSLASLVQTTPNPLTKIFSNLRILFVPVVNVDSVTLISNSFGTLDWLRLKNLRKNRHGKDSECPPNDFGGVDLNRNYAKRFYAKHGEDNSELKNKCSEEFRGSRPFSEPETMAIKGLIERFDRIVSAMNFHAYGGLWIFPANFDRKSGINTLQKKNPYLYSQYQLFKKRIPKVFWPKFGNAMQTINYFANGEASDWMVFEKGIMAFSPELGTSDSRTDHFYPSASLHREIIDIDFNVIKEFLLFQHPVLRIQKETPRGSSLTFSLHSPFPLKDVIIHPEGLSLSINGFYIGQYSEPFGLRHGDKITVYRPNTVDPSKSIPLSIGRLREGQYHPIPPLPVHPQI